MSQTSVATIATPDSRCRQRAPDKAMRGAAATASRTIAVCRAIIAIGARSRTSHRPRRAGGAPATLPAGRSRAAATASAAIRSIFAVRSGVCRLVGASACAPQDASAFIPDSRRAAPGECRRREGRADQKCSRKPACAKGPNSKNVHAHPNVAGSPPVANATSTSRLTMSDSPEACLPALT